MTRSISNTGGLSDGALSSGRVVRNAQDTERKIPENVIDSNIARDSELPSVPASVWSTFSPVSTWTTNTVITARYRVLHDMLDAVYVISLSGVPDAADLTVDLPSGWQMDTTAAPGTYVSAGPPVLLSESGQFPRIGAAWINGSSPTVLRIHHLVDDTTFEQTARVNQTLPFAWGAGDLVLARITSLPVVAA